MIQKIFAMGIITVGLLMLWCGVQILAIFLMFLSYVTWGV